MLGLFGTLNLATRALQAQQTGVETAGQNLANVNNPAYARQRVQLSTAPSVATAFGPQGTGVQVNGIIQVRDALLDSEVCDETSVGAFWEAQQGGLQSTQTALREFLDQNASAIESASAGTSGVAQGLAKQISQFFNAFQGVATNPTSLSARQTLANQADLLATGFNQASARLSAVGDELDRGLTRAVDSANQLLAEIADLNKEISRMEVPGGGKANDLRDTRQQKLEELAKLTDFQLGSDSDGSPVISIGGRTVLTGRTVVDRLETANDSTGKLIVRFASDADPASIAGGTLSGLMSVRDGLLADMRSGIDSLAAEMIASTNAIYRTGYDLNGNTGADLFTGAGARDMGVNAILLEDPSRLQASGRADEPGDNQVALALARAGTALQPGLANHTFGDAYGLLVMKLGNALANANEQVTNHGMVSELLLARRDSVSGVSMEEEMTSLMTFQKAYQASARIVSTVDQMLEEVLSLKR